MGGTFGPESNAPERACQGDLGGIITSGGGFSSVTPRPYWQDDAVANYFSQYSPAGSYNSGGAGVPDVSLLSYNYEIVFFGINTVGSGTSASAPLFAAMVSLVNAARLKAGKNSIGFLNIILYSSYGNFTNDITEGINNCAASSTAAICCNGKGFNASRGWDPITGLGSVNFDTFSTFLIGLGSDGEFAHIIMNHLIRISIRSLFISYSSAHRLEWVHQYFRFGSYCDDRGSSQQSYFHRIFHKLNSPNVAKLAWRTTV